MSDGLVVALALWVVAGIQVVRTLRGAGSWSLTVAVVALATGLTIDADVVSAALGRSVVLAVVEHTSILVAAVATLAFIRCAADENGHLANPVRRAAWIVAAVALTAPLLRATQELPAAAEARADVYADSPFWGIHWATFLGLLMVVMCRCAVLGFSNAPRARGLLRVRLVGIGVACVVGAGYAVLKSVLLVTLALSLGSAELADVLSAAEQAALMLSITITAAALLAGAVESIRQEIVVRSRVWALWPLWVGLWEHAPHMPSATPPRRLAATLARESRMILVRQVVELGDATRTLGPFLRERDASSPADEARALADAAARRSAGAIPEGPGQPAPGSTVDERVAYLRPIARGWGRTGAAASKTGAPRGAPVRTVYDSDREA
ncbi:hypothetical protein Cch01nite_18750 [Cellulomonas chitinilytica]|uniref:DUF6545 domain-containing protein n=1 Tax=Cellulomonas chitinilytica TaxID=398759 RepID=A0A919P3X7_9CELL|nr:DUF6545 domain-containing protein [Cellulomonas chitinilytica]GIG21151.1 hypothetical protein Cch01nite_18750 [Cellulomonas chitinilytica]